MGFLRKLFGLDDGEGCCGGEACRCKRHAGKPEVAAAEDVVVKQAAPAEVKPADDYLKGRQCPKCGRSDDLDVEVRQWARIHHDRLDIIERDIVRWSSGSGARCACCGWAGQFRDTLKEPSGEAAE
jgi:hypothetical protein